QVARPRVLQHLAVDALLHPDVGRIEARSLHDLRPDGAEGVVPLASEPLPVAELRVAGADVVSARVARDHVERALLRDVLPGLAVDVTDAFGKEDRVAVADERVRELGEEERRLRQLHARLACVVAVVEADADDLRVTTAEAVGPLVAHAHGAVTSPSSSSSR